MTIVIKAAPGAAAADVGDMTQISLKLTKVDLAKIDQAAAVRRIGRAAFIRQACFQVIKEDAL